MSNEQLAMGIDRPAIRLCEANMGREDALVSLIV